MTAPAFASRAGGARTVRTCAPSAFSAVKDCGALVMASARLWACAPASPGRVGVSGATLPATCASAGGRARNALMPARWWGLRCAMTTGCARWGLAPARRTSAATTVPAAVRAFRRPPAPTHGNGGMTVAALMAYAGASAHASTKAMARSAAGMASVTPAFSGQGTVSAFPSGLAQRANITAVSVLHMGAVRATAMATVCANMVMRAITVRIPVLAHSMACRVEGTRVGNVTAAMQALHDARVTRAMQGAHVNSNAWVESSRRAAATACVKQSTVHASVTVKAAD